MRRGGRGGRGGREKRSEEIGELYEGKPRRGERRGRVVPTDFSTTKLITTKPFLF